MGKISKLTASYIAGYLDGEGYFGIMRLNKGNHISYQPVIKVASVNQEIILWFKNSYGGYIHHRKFQNNSKDAYSWTLAGAKVKPFLVSILPYLWNKKPQALLVLKRINLFNKIGTKDGKVGSNFKYPDNISRQIEDLYKQIRILNQRGLVQSERLSEETPLGEAIV